MDRSRKSKFKNGVNGVSPFGIAFDAAVRRHGTHVKHDSFDTKAIEVKKEELGQFIDALRITLAVAPKG